ncbi:MAG: T9SS type A sorting domain-containing protein [Bacteroidales bacterium]|nr:T9SS type A sorting domain-containing protein [Bacteroidales bacterium]
MKNFNSKFLLGLFILIVLFNLSSKAWIYSTAEGGPWDSTWTWVAGVVPGPADDVVLNGPVHTSGNTCNNLSLSISGELFNTNYTITFTATGNVENNGIIRNNINGWKFNINVGGNITNNGTWENHYTYLTGPGTHTLSQTGGNMISCYEFNASEGTGLITVMTDFNFNNTRIMLNGATIELHDSKGGNLYVYGQFIDNGNLIANNHNLFLEGNAYLEDLILSDANLSGIIQINGNNVVFNGNTILNGTLQNYNYTCNLIIYNNFTNNGVVQNKGNGWYLNTDHFGNIVNNGTWNNYGIELWGTSDQELSCLNQHEFAVHDFIDQEPIGLINALTNLSFVNCNINLNYDTLLMPNNSMLSVSGGYIYKSVIYPPVGSTSLNMNNGSYIQDCDISNVTLEGIVECNATDFYGDIILEGVIQNYVYTITVNIFGDLTNNGEVRNKGNGWDLYLDIYGDIINNGIWSNKITSLEGVENHSVTQGPESEFSGYEVNAVAGTGLITFMTDIDFHNTRLLLNGGTIEIDNSKGGNISMIGGFFDNGTLVANSHNFFQTGNSYIEDLIISDVTLKGIIQINENNVILNGNIILEDTIQNYGNNCNLTINNSFTNNGVIKDKGNGWHLYMDNFGDIINNGVWQNVEIELKGESDQNISCLNDNVFAVSNFIDQQPEGLINALTGLNFENCNINLNYDTLIMPDNSTLSIYNNYITKSVVYSSGGSFTLQMENLAYINDCDITDVTLEGDFECLSTDFFGEIIHNGTMKNRGNNQTVTVYGNITNNGIIKNNGNGWNLYVDITGNLSNNGEWSNYYTRMIGTIEQHIYLFNHNDIIGQVRFVSEILVPPYQWYFNGNSLPASPEYSGQTSHTIIFNIPVTEEFDGIFYCFTGGGYSRDIKVQSIYGPPIANFAADITSWYAPMEVNFTDLSASGNAPIDEWYWDFGDGNTSDVQNPTHTYENLGSYTVSLTVTDENGLYDTETKIDYINVLSAQQIQLTEGYGFVSTRILPEEPNFNSVCVDILPNLDFVRNTSGDMFRKIGPVWVNGIGDWVTTEGYLFRMNSADELIILGDVINPQSPISLISGYQFISYLPENSTNALTVFNDVLANLDFVRNSVGSMLRKIGPIWVNGIGDMNPGEGYLVKMLNADELIYPVTDEKFSGVSDLVPEYFQFEGGNAADPVFTIYIKDLKIGDEVAAFDGDKIIGSLKINSKNAFENELAVFNTINSGQGYQAGNSIQLKVWDSFSQMASLTEFEMIDPYNEAYMQKVYPNEDGLYSVVKFSKSLIGNENIDNEISIYPNPSNGLITIENLKGSDLKIKDIRGRIFFQSEIKRSNASTYGNQKSKIKIDLSDLESGVYFVHVNGKDFNKVEKIVIQ